MPESLKLDPKNSRKHSPNNQAAIRKSLQAVGAFRSIGAVRGTVKVGNGVFQEAQKLGYEIVHVKAEPNQLICVDRDDMTEAQAESAAVLDNLVSDTSAHDYHLDLLREALENDPISKAIAEQDARLRALLKENTNLAEDGLPVDLKSQWMVLIECENEQSQTALLERFSMEGLACRALTS